MCTVAFNFSRSALNSKKGNVRAVDKWPHGEYVDSKPSWSIMTYLTFRKVLDRGTGACHLFSVAFLSKVVWILTCGDEVCSWIEWLLEGLSYWFDIAVGGNPQSLYHVFKIPIVPSYDLNGYSIGLFQWQEFPPICDSLTSQGIKNRWLPNMVSGHIELRSIDQVILQIPNHFQHRKRGQVDYIKSTWPCPEGIEVTISPFVTYLSSRQCWRVIYK